MNIMISYSEQKIRKQREWIDKNGAKPIHIYRLNETEEKVVKQFIKSFS